MHIFVYQQENRPFEILNAHILTSTSTYCVKAGKPVLVLVLETQNSEAQSLYVPIKCYFSSYTEVHQGTLPKRT